VTYFATLAGYEVSGCYWADGRVLLGVMILFVQLPLAFLKKIDFLGFTSFIGMGCMMSFVGLVVVKQPAAVDHCGSINYTSITSNFLDPECEAKSWIFNIKSAYAVPTLLFAFMCHGNILPIVAELKPTDRCNSRHPSPRRIRQMVFGALAPTTVLYVTTALFAYYSYFNRTESFLLELYALWLDPSDVMLIISKIMVTLCITFSVPVLHYPCRYSLWNLLHQVLPNYVPVAYDNGYPETWNRKWYYICALLLQGILFVIACMVNEFGLVVGLGGSVAGTCIILIFPASFYLKIHRWRRDSFYDKVVWFMMIFGYFTLVANTSMILVEEFVLKGDPEAVSNMTQMLTTASPIDVQVNLY
jgi:sodium-coupled neutral amino acid transporter 1